MLSGTLKAQPAAAENLEKALARPGAFEGLLRHLRQLRREVLRKTARGTWNLNGDERSQSQMAGAVSGAVLGFQHASAPQVRAC